MAKIEISAWEIAEKFGLCYTGLVETTNKWHEQVDYYTFDFHNKKIKIEENFYQYSELSHYQERAAEIVLFNIGRALAEDMTDWVE